MMFVRTEHSARRMDHLMIWTGFGPPSISCSTSHEIAGTRVPQRKGIEISDTQRSARAQCPMIEILIGTGD
jgi:hypothetical protein